mgnify:FL=1
MNIRVVGLNHQTAPVQVREALSFARPRLPEALAALRSQEGVEEAAILSTCNRVELYAASSGALEGAALRGFLAKFHGVWPETFEPLLYERAGAEGARHLFRVASGLDSLVVGEAQVTAQVKDAYEAAAQAGAAGPVLHRLFQQALTVAKRVRTLTDIGAGRASVGSVAVELAQRIFESLAGRTVLVVGAGEMGEAVAASLAAAGARATLVANRSLARAEALAARWGGQAVAFENLPDCLARADIVISSTDAPHHVIRQAEVAAALRARRGRPLFIIDIAVPRDVEPAVAAVEGCYLYNVDDLDAVVAETRARRAAELSRCEAIVDAEVAAFERWLRGLAVAPMISELSERLHALKRAELEALRRRLPGLPEADLAEIERMADRLVKKILHQPIRTLRELSPGEPSGGILRAALRLFGLGRNPPEGNKEGDTT